MRLRDSTNEEFRHGSAAWAEAADLRKAGLFSKSGLPLGFFGGKMLRLESDAPLLTIGGAGSGKLRDLLGYVVTNSTGERLLLLDPRGELAAISLHTFAPAGEYAYVFSPMGGHGLPQHACNPLDILNASTAHFHSDVKFIAEGLIPLSGSANGQYFEIRAREWLAVLLKSIVERDGTTSFPKLYNLVNEIEGNPETWASHLEFMMASNYPDVQRVAVEMLTKSQDSPKEFGSIMGEIYAHLSFLSDPALLASLDGDGFSLKVLCDPHVVSKVFLNIPAEYLGLWSPLIRTMFTVTMLYKSRLPHGHRITFVIDEAGQLGRFEALKKAYTYGRGAGIRVWAFFQDVGQIIQNFGASAVQTFMGSAQVRQFVGPRDYQTAKLVSDMLGSETLYFDEALRQSEAQRKRTNLAQSILDGMDPFEAAADFAYEGFASDHRSQQGRSLLTPDEVLNLREDEQVIFISGKNLNPILANKYPYFTRREMAGLYLPNPYHPPLDRVRIKAFWGYKWVRIITAPVPEKWATFPQYQTGRMVFVEGYPLSS